MQLSQVKEKEEFSNLEDYEDPAAGVHLQYAVANTGTSSTDPPHSRSDGDIANLAIVMSSHVNKMKCGACS